MDYTYENYTTNVSDAPEPYLWRSSMMNQWQIDPTNSGSWTPEQRAKVRRATEIYNPGSGPSCRMSRSITSCRGPMVTIGMDVLLESKPQARHVVYLRPNSDTPAQSVLLKGLEPTATYKVRAEDHSTRGTTYSGQELMNSGLVIHLPGRYTSDLIYLEEVR